MGIVSPTKKRILQEVQARPAHGYRLSQALNLPVSYIYQHLAELREAGFVKAQEKGRARVYYLTKKGEMFLKSLE